MKNIKEHLESTSMNHPIAIIIKSFQQAIVLDNKSLLNENISNADIKNETTKLIEDIKWFRILMCLAVIKFYSLTLQVTNKDLNY